MLTAIQDWWCRAFHSQHCPRRGYFSCECGRRVRMRDSLNYRAELEPQSPKAFERVEPGIDRAGTEWFERNIR
jgi:hypothetical protein